MPINPKTSKKAHFAATGPLLYKIDEAADCLGISPASIRRLIVRGDLVAIRKIRHVLVTAESVRRFAGLDALDGKEAQSAAVSAL
jgi:hypothetical protein